MFKRIIIILLFISSINYSYSQFLHIGVRGFVTPIIYMDYYEYDVTDYVYYFSNDHNETMRFSGFEFSQIKSFSVSPDIYLRYDLGNHIYIQTDIFYMKFSNEAKYNNSVDYENFVHEFNPGGYIDNLEYNTIKLRWKFTGNSLSVGYKMFKSKNLRPFIFGGFSSMYLMSFEHSTLEDQAKSEIDINSVQKERIYNNIIFKNLDTYELVTYYYKLGFGFKFHALSLDFYFTSSLPNRNIDIYADKYNEGFKYDGDITLLERANYKSTSSLNASLSFNFLSYNLTKKHLQY